MVSHKPLQSSSHSKSASAQMSSTISRKSPAPIPTLGYDSWKSYFQPSIIDNSPLGTPILLIPKGFNALAPQTPSPQSHCTMSNRQGSHSYHLSSPEDNPLDQISSQISTPIGLGPLSSCMPTYDLNDNDDDDAMQDVISTPIHQGVSNPQLS
jgi:hypothetical protein